MMKHVKNVPTPKQIRSLDTATGKKRTAAASARKHAKFELHQVNLRR